MKPKPTLQPLRLVASEQKKRKEKERGKERKKKRRKEKKERWEMGNGKKQTKSAVSMYYSRKVHSKNPQKQKKEINERKTTPGGGEEWIIQEPARFRDDPSEKNSPLIHPTFAFCKASQTLISSFSCSRL